MKFTKTLFFLGILLFISAQQSVSAANISYITQDVLHFGTTAGIHGDSFGAWSSDAQVCWSGYCLNSQDITSWTDKRILIAVHTVDMPYSGTLEIHNFEGGETIYASGPTIYMRPTIEEVFVDGKEAASVSEGQKVVITGKYLGDPDQGNTELSLNGAPVGEIESWSNNKIVFEAEFSADLKIEVRNHVLQSASYIPGSVTTQENSSYFQITAPIEEDVDVKEEVEEIKESEETSSETEDSGESDEDKSAIEDRYEILRTTLRDFILQAITKCKEINIWGSKEGLRSCLQGEIKGFIKERAAVKRELIRDCRVKGAETADQIRSCREDMIK